MRNLRLTPQQKSIFYEAVIKIGQRKGHFPLKVGFVQQARHKSNIQHNKIIGLFNIKYLTFVF